MTVDKVVSPSQSTTFSDDVTSDNNGVPLIQNNVDAATEATEVIEGNGGQLSRVNGWRMGGEVDYDLIC